jgi:chromosome segregation ATPase
MRRHRGLTIGLVTAAAAFAAAGCGGDTVGQATTQAGEAVESADGVGLSDAIRETRDVTGEVTDAAQELAKDPDADVDARLADAEQRARALSDRLQNDADGQPEVTAALRSANERIASAASDLQDASTSEQVTEITDSAFEEIDKQLRAVATDAAGDATRSQLEDARDAAEDLRSKVGG